MSRPERSQSISTDWKKTFGAESPEPPERAERTALLEISNALSGRKDSDNDDDSLQKNLLFLFQREFRRHKNGEAEGKHDLPADCDSPPPEKEPEQPTNASKEKGCFSRTITICALVTGATATALALTIALDHFHPLLFSPPWPHSYL